MSYFHETIWKGVPKFLRRVDTALKNIGINERVPYNAPLIQFSSWMGGDRDGTIFICYRYMYVRMHVCTYVNSM
jgi:phosphoenolpyruvate carboxylase